jgi:hypothetical protein
MTNNNRVGDTTPRLTICIEQARDLELVTINIIFSVVRAVVMLGPLDFRSKETGEVRQPQQPLSLCCGGHAVPGEKGSLYYPPCYVVL